VPAHRLAEAQGRVRADEGDGSRDGDKGSGGSGGKGGCLAHTCCAVLPGVFQNERRGRRRTQQVLAVPRSALLLACVSNQGLSAAQEGLQEVKIATASDVCDSTTLNNVMSGSVRLKLPVFLSDQLNVEKL